MVSRDDGPRELRLHARPAAPREIASQVSVTKKTIDGAYPPGGVSFRDEQSGIANDVWDLAAVARDDRHTARHRLDQHAAELFPPLDGGLARRA